NLMDELQVGHVADQHGVSLSGGERRRVEIARALAARPRLMLLDEPFAGVDPISVGEIQRIVSHLRNRGIGVLITDHNVRETLGICDRAYILNDGEVLAQGAPDQLLSNPDVRRVYLDEGSRLYRAACEEALITVRAWPTGPDHAAVAPGQAPHADVGRGAGTGSHRSGRAQPAAGLGRDARRACRGRPCG